MGIAYIESRWLVRQPLWLVQGLVSSIGFTMLMFFWGGVEALKNMILAWLIAGAWSNGLNIVAQSIGWSRLFYDYERLVASPVTLAIYFIGVVAGNLPFFFLVDVLPAFIISLLVKMTLQTILALLALSPLALTLGALTSLYIILRLKNPTNISAITNPLNTITVTLPPVYYPLTPLPQILRIIALVVPTVSFMEISRWTTNYPYTCFDPILPTIMLAVWLLIITPLTLKKLKWGLE